MEYGMKAELHPEYHETTIKCACGNEVKTRSTVRDLHVEICSACHPFYTGKQKLVDSAGRIEKFNRKYKNLRSAPAPTAAPEPAPAAEAAPAEEAASAPESAPH